MYLDKKQSYYLIALCFLVYTAGYIGRLNYNASLIEIISFYGATKAEGGLVSSFFFFAYGLGQFVNGILSKRYNPRIMLFISLTTSSAINLIMPFLPGLVAMKWFWLFNGFSQSILWCTIIKTLSKYVPDDLLPKAILVISTTIAIGTFFAYGLSAACIAAGNWRMVFYIAGAIMFAIALIWFFGFGYLKKGADSNLIPEDTLPDNTLNAGKKKFGFWGMLAVILLGLMFVAVANGFVKDGTVTWTPLILYEEFNLDKAYSVILTFFIPLLSIFGAFLASRLRKKTDNFYLLIGIFYLVSFVCFLFFLRVSLPNQLFFMTLLLFIVIACCMAAINNILTSMIPLYYRERINSGIAAGVINTFCYVGSTLSSISLGLIADTSGWRPVFIILTVISAAAVAFSLISALTSKMKKEKKKDVER